MNRIQSTIQPVIQALADSSRTYEAAADKTGWDDLKRAFQEIAERRQGFAEHLRSAVDGEELPSRSLASALREGWMKLRDQLSQDQYGLLAELERAEDALLLRYRRTVAEEKAPERVAALLREQLAEVESAHDRIRDLRDSEKAARQA